MLGTRSERVTCWWSSSNEVERTLIEYTLSIFPPKNNVKTQNRLNHFHPATSAWRISFVPQTILGTEIKEPRLNAARFSF
jgi:hypothetical protein